MDPPADNPDAPTDASPALPGRSDPSVGSPVPPAKRSWFDKPLFWLGLVAAGVVLAVSLSFAAERTNLNGTVGDVGKYCQQVGVVRGLASGAALDPSQSGVDQANALVTKLKALELVAPAPVHEDVTTVRMSAETLAAALGDIQKGSAGARSSTIQDVTQALTAGETAIHDLTEYTQEACGIDLSAPDTLAGSSDSTTPGASTPSTVRSTTSTAP